jgi:hypothetical protein
MFLCDNYTEHGWAFDVDLLYLCKLTGRSILEYPINWIEQEESKLTFADGVTSTFGLFKVFGEMGRGRCPKRLDCKLYDKDSVVCNYTRGHYGGRKATCYKGKV